MPVVEANTLLGQIFKSRFGKDLETIHTVGNYDKRKLDLFYAKRNYFEERFEFANDKRFGGRSKEERITIYSKDI